MKSHIAIALIALSVTSVLAAPKNEQEVERSEKETLSVVADKQKGDASLLSTYQNDQMIRTCVGFECKWMNAGSAKALDFSSIKAVFPESRDTEMTKALTPTVDSVMASMKGLDEQKSRLEKLQAEMAAMTAMFDKGAQAAASTNGQFAAMMTKGVNFPAAAPPTKAFAAAMPPSKGSFAFASKGNSAAANMQLEAAMCPMTMYELGKSQKLYAETNAQLQNANTMASMLMAEKNNLENQKASLEAGKRSAEAQASFNAKYAAEQKQRGDLLDLEVAKLNSEKDALLRQKAGLEAALAASQRALADERDENAALTEALNACNQEKAQLQEDKEALTNELKETQDVLRQTQRELEQEQNAHARTQRQLAATQQELEATEKARQLLEQAKQELEDELQETKDQLESMTDERNQLQVTLDATSAMLAKCNEDKMQCNAELSQEKAVSAQLKQQLEDAVTVIAAEKKAREEITALLMSVKEAAEKLQEEVQKLQIENVQLKQQLMKLKSEQEVALAMAAGCPPTYEKFGISCYKYVREKTQWKMAQEQCMKDGGNLVSVESRQEQAFLVDYLKRHEARFDDKYLHLGGFDYNADGVFKWLSTKNPVDLGDAFWLQNNPRGMGRRCLAFQTWEMAMFGQWADEYCWVTLPFVCEIVTSPFA